MKNSVCALLALGLLASELQASPTPEAVSLGWAGFEQLGGPACRPGEPASQGLQEQPALQVYRDPATGRFTVPPPGLVPVVPKVLKIPLRPLVERRVERPGGGVRVDLGERFSSALVVTRGEDGRLRTECLHDARHPSLESETAEGAEP